MNSTSSRQTLGKRIRRLGRWLEPGLGIKRWLALGVVGMALVALALAVLILDIYRSNPASPLLAVLSLRGLPRWERAVIFGLSGIALTLVSFIQLNHTLLAPYLRPGRPVVDAVANHRKLERGLRIVAVGGGTGLSALLRGLKAHTANITAVVTMADDGGSSGRLRQALGLPPPGDLRSCLAALSDDEDLLSQLFQYRFSQGDELSGHSFGNLFIAALAKVTGSFETGVLEAGKVLAIRGRVLPSTLSDVRLVAEKSAQPEGQLVRVRGESHIPEVTGRITHVQLDPGNPRAYPEVIRAILNADMVVVGPGSLYTSIIPNLLVPDLQEAIRTTKAFKAYVCNIATQPGETDGFSALDHLDAIHAHAAPPLFNVMIANDTFAGSLPPRSEWIRPPREEEAFIPVYLADLTDPEQPGRHRSNRLAEVLIDLLLEKTSPLELGMPERESLEPTNGS
jgi:uncharacterized cofD-like protein